MKLRACYNLVVRQALFALLLTAGCSTSSKPSMNSKPSSGGADLSTSSSSFVPAPGTPDPSGPPPGFKNACAASTDCAGYADDALNPVGHLGCGSFVNINYCTRPCNGQWPGCWAGTTCTCVNHTNVSGYMQTDCLCTQ